MGPEIDFTNSLWRPTGDYEFVVFLGESVTEQYQDLKVVSDRSLEWRAMRYLRPCSPEWVRKNRMRGLSVVFSMRGVSDGLPQELRDMATEGFRPIHHFIAADSHLLEKVQGAGDWSGFDFDKCEDGIWGAWGMRK